jgi:hypothetical protein
MMCCSTPVPLDEMLYRLNLSTWVRRMWTFQEAVLVKRLQIQLSDGYERLIHISSHFNTMVKSTDVVFTPGVKKNLLLFPLTIACLQYQKLSAPRQLYAIAIALAMRKTSKPTDEAISVATLLGQGLDEVLRVHGKERWPAHLPTLKDPMSPTVIFMRGPKMTSVRYCWAPSTFLDLDDETKLSYLARREGAKDPPLNITDTGLTVSFPGFLFGATTKPLTPIFCFESKATGERFWATTGTRPTGTASWNVEDPPSGIRYGLIMQKIPDDRSTTRAVLLADCSINDGVIYGSYVCTQCRKVASACRQAPICQ